MFFKEVMPVSGKVLGIDIIDFLLLAYLLVLGMLLVLNTNFTRFLIFSLSIY